MDKTEGTTPHNTRKEVAADLGWANCEKYHLKPGLCPSGPAPPPIGKLQSAYQDKTTFAKP